jgi:iron(III) transport system substrate-binding protein
MKLTNDFARFVRLGVAGLALVAGVSGLTLSSAAPASAETAEEIEAAANEEGVLLIYTSTVDALMKVIAPAFEATHPGIRVSWIRLSSSTVFNRYVAESEAGVVQGDLLWTASTQLYQERPEMFAELTPEFVPNLAIEASIQPKNDHYVVVTASPHIVTYNTDSVTEADLAAHLATWEGLTDPRWTGRIALVDPRGSASATSFLLTLGDTYGDDWLTALGQQVQLVDRGTTGAQQAAAGAFDLVVPADMSHTAELRAQQAPVSTYAPGGPAHGLEHSMAIPLESTHPAAARLFMNWALSAEGQTVLCGLDMAALREADASCQTVSPDHVSPRDSVPDDVEAELFGLLGITP